MWPQAYSFPISICCHACLMWRLYARLPSPAQLQKFSPNDVFLPHPCTDVATTHASAQLPFHPQALTSVPNSTGLSSAPLSVALLTSVNSSAALAELCGGSTRNCFVSCLAFLAKKTCLREFEKEKRVSVRAVEVSFFSPWNVFQARGLIEVYSSPQLVYPPP